MRLTPYRFLSDRTRLIIRISFGSLLLLSLFWVVREITCDWNCDAHRAAQRHVDALANNDYDSYASSVSVARVEDFEFQLTCLDWNQARVGEVRDSLVASDLKKVVLHTPSGDFFLNTGVRPPEHGTQAGRGFMVGVRPDTCPLDLDVLLRLEELDD